MGVGHIILIVLGALTFFATLMVGIFTLVGRFSARIAARVVADGVLVRRSGRLVVGTRLRNFRSPERYASHKISKNFGEILLMREALVVVAGLVLLRLDPAKTEMSVDGEKLRLKTSEPIGATGEVEVSAKLDDREGWMRALSERGASAAT